LIGAERDAVDDTTHTRDRIPCANDPAAGLQQLERSTNRPTITADRVRDRALRGTRTLTVRAGMFGEHSQDPEHGQRTNVPAALR
jgi:hypothetical protein